MTKTLVRFGFLAFVAILMIATFSLITSMLSAKNASAGAPTCTWTGGGVNENWSNASNWSCESGTIPIDGTTIILGINPTHSSSTPSHNDLSASNTYSGIEMVVTPTANDQVFYINGNALRLAGDVLISNPTAYANAFIRLQTASFTLASNATITVSAATNLALSMETTTVALGAFNLIFDASQVTGAQSAPTQLSMNFSTVTGTGDITLTGGAKRGYLVLNNATLTSYSGDIFASDTELAVNCGSTTAFGNTTGATVLTGATVISCNRSSASGSVSIPENITFSQFGYGTQWNDSGYFVSEGTFGATYAKRYFTTSAVTLSGQVTLTGNTTFGSASDITISGNIVGSYTIAPFSSLDYGGRITITSASNGSLTTNGVYRLPLATTTLADSLGSTTIFIGAMNRVIVNGTRGATTVKYGGVLSGSGTVGALTVLSSKIATGNSAGILNSGSVSFDSGSSMDVEIGGTTAGTGYDQLNVTGTVSLGSSTLNISNINSFIPTLNDTFTIINNDGADAVTGTFTGLAQGGTRVVGDVTYTISYTGGTGNDVVLTATVTPGPPDTSGVLARPINLAIAGLVVISGIALLVLRKKFISARYQTARSRARR